MFEQCTSCFQESTGKEMSLNANSTFTPDKIQNVLHQLETSADKYPFWQKLKEICSYCASQSVNLYIDAEYSQLQPVVRALTLALMKAGNQQRGAKFVIYNTYQCYLQDCQAHLQEDIQIAKELHFSNWGCKLVRGAYLQSETQNFQQGKLARFPLHPSYEETNSSYNSALNLLMGHLKEMKHLYLTIATHNLESVEKGLQHLDENDTLKTQVNFAQINGLADPLSLALAQKQVRVLKLLPCGSVQEVLPWLGR